MEISSIYTTSLNGLARILILLLLYLGYSSPLFAQIPDSIKPDIAIPSAQPASSTLQEIPKVNEAESRDTTSIAKKKKSQISSVMMQDSLSKKERRKLRRKNNINPKRAWLLSIIPAGGQFYNRRWIKGTLVLGGIGFLGYYSVITSQDYRRIRDAHAFRVDDDPNTIDEFTDANGNETISTASLLRLRDNLNKRKEQSYIWLIAGWGLSGVEAFADAHLRTFDVNENLAMKIKPQLDFPIIGPQILGLTLQFNIQQKPFETPPPFLP